jgi:hypothetical protein
MMDPLMADMDPGAHGLHDVDRIDDDAVPAEQRMHDDAANAF